MNCARLLLAVSLALVLCTSAHAVAAYSAQAIGSSDFTGQRINNYGQVAGNLNTLRDVGFWDGTTLHNFGAFCTGSTVVRGLNDEGQISGYTAVGGARTAYLCADGIITTGPAGTATGMNANGQVVGYVSSPSSVFVWDGQTTTYLASGTVGRAINDLGQVACDSTPDGYMWDGATLRNLGSLGGIHTRPYAINNKGQVVGACELTANGDSRAFLWQNGVIQGIGTLGGYDEYAVAINERSQIIGVISGQSAWLSENGVMYDLNSLLPADSGWSIYNAMDINDKGQILCLAHNADNAYFTLILNPIVPEPQSILVVLSGLTGLACLRRRR